MHLIRVGGAAVNQTPLDWDGNRDRIGAAIAAARAAGVSVLCLPELCISGYGCEDAFLSPGVQRMAWRVLEEIEPASRGLFVAVGLPVRFENAVYDAALATFETSGGLFSQQASPGFIELWSLQSRMAHRLRASQEG